MFIEPLFAALGGIREAFGLAAVVTTLIGIWLHWKRQSHLSDIEESVKNGAIGPEEARRRIRIVDWRAPILVLVGVTLLVYVAVGGVD